MIKRSSLMAWFISMLLGALISHSVFAQPSSASASHAMVSQKPQADIVDQIVAVVNNGVITQRQLDKRLELVEQRFKQQKTPLPPLPQLQIEVLNQMVMESLQLQKAREDGIVVTDEMMQAALARIAQANRLTVEQYQQEVQKNGMLWSDFLSNLKTEITLARLYELQIESKVSVSDVEVTAYLASQQGMGAPENQDLWIEHIFIPKGEDKAAAQQKAQDILQKALAQPTEFKTLAKNYSASSDAKKGGDLGYRSPLDLIENVVNATTTIRPGQVYPEVIEVPMGFEIIKLIGRREGQGGSSVSAPIIIQTHVRHILLRVDGNDSDAQALEKIKQIHQQLMNGADFAEMARKYSQDGSASQGGDLGWISPGQTVPEFERAMNQLSLNQISGPVRTQFGYHLIQVLSRRQVQGSAAQEMALARQAIGQRKSNELYSDWLNQLRSSAFVQYYFNGIPVTPGAN